MDERLPRRGYVGLSVGTTARSSGGLPVRAVARGSAAERAGVRPGDGLTHLDHNPVADVLEVRTLLRGLRSGDPLLVDVLRDGEPLSLSTEVGEFPLERHEGASVEPGAVDVGGHRLRAISVVPDRRGPHPVIYFLPGAHWASEEYPLTPEHPVPGLLGALARAGYASVRVERSGLGDSQGPPCARADFETELAGYRCGYAFVRARPWADPDQVFLLGHSLGAMLAPLLAREHPPAGIICYAASALPISAALVNAIRRHARLSGGNPAAVRHAEKLAELIALVVTGGRTPQAVFTERPDLQEAAPDHFSGDQAYHRVVTFYHQLERADLVAAWRAFSGPSLFVYGERDTVCSADDSRALVELAGGQASFVSLPGVDHQMSARPTAEPPALARGVFEAIAGWLRSIRVESGGGDER